MSRLISDRKPAERRSLIEDVLPKGQASLAAVVAAEITPRLSLLHATVSAVSKEMAPHSGPEEISRFARLVLDPDASIARRHVADLKECGLSPERVFVELFEPAARCLGGMWNNDECDFMDVAGAMARLHFLLATMECDMKSRALFEERSILMSTMPGSQHSFGIAVVEKLLTAWGWRVKSERPESMDQILNVVSKHPVAVIGLSVSRTNELATLARAVAKIRRHSKNSAICVMVGGPALCEKPEIAATVGADATAANGLLAVLAAQQLFDRRLESSTRTIDKPHAGAISMAMKGTANARLRFEADEKAQGQSGVSISAGRGGRSSRR